MQSPEQLAQLEALCHVLYTSPDPAQRTQAEGSLQCFFVQPEYIPQCQFILDHSQQPYALVMAASSLTRQISEHWGNFTIPQRVEMRNYVVNYLAERGPKLISYATSSLIQLLCRMTKLGWFDDQAHRDIVEDVTKFLQASVEHCSIGLQIYNALITEMNQPPTGNRSLTQHRKVANSFRDQSLYSIFQIAITTLRQLFTHAVPVPDSALEEKLKEQALSLTLQCLSFDFIGTTVDESSEDVGTIQIPNTWRPVIEDPETMRLFFDLYASCQPNCASLAIECLVQMASVRRSLFSDDRTRKQFLSKLIQGVNRTLQARTGLHDQANHHVVCRLLSRIKANNQLSDLVASEGYQEWIALVADFTITTFQTCQWASNGIHYLLNLWSRLVSSVPYLKGDSPGLLEQYVPQVVQSYIQSRVQGVALLVQNDSLEDPLDEEELLTEQLEAIPILCRFLYERISSFLVSVFEPVAQSYKAIAAEQGTANHRDQLSIREGELTWLVYIVGAVVGGRQGTSSSEAHEVIDGELASFVFQLMQFHVSTPVPAPNGRSEKICERLELAFLYFLQQFRKVYIGEQAMSSTKVYSRLSERLGIHDHPAVLNMMVAKIAANLKTWVKNESVVDKSLSLFHDLASGYSSGKLLLKLDTITYLLTNHGSDTFPFLDVPSNTRHRTTFYNILSKLLFMEEANLNARFQAFVQPLNSKFAFLSSQLSKQFFVQDNVKSSIIGLLRDLRGIASATSTRRNYNLFFDWIYPSYMPVLVFAAEALFDVEQVMVPLLKFMSEFVFNRSQRLVFDSSSPNGILLFRETSKILVAYGSRILGHRVSHDVYAEKYKGIGIALTIFARALGGNYVNFGVFALYGDRALSDALDVALKISLSIPLNDLMAYPKVAKAYFALIEIVCHNHTMEVVSLDTETFVCIVTSIHDGLKSIDTNISSQCAAALDHLATFYFNNAGLENAAARHVQKHLTAHPDLLPRLLAVLLNIVLFEDCTNQWSVSRPMLTLILTNEKFFNEYKQQILSSQPPDRQAKLVTSFNKLMADIQPNLESKNRDKFTQNLTIFRHDFRSKLTS